MMQVRRKASYKLLSLHVDNYNNIVEYEKHLNTE